MKKTLALVSLFSALILSGCGAMQVQDIDVYKDLVKNPVHQVYIFTPAFSPKYEVRMKDWTKRDDYQEMKLENQPASSATILSVFSSVLASSTNYTSLTLATDYVPDEKALEWAKNLSQILVKNKYSEKIVGESKPDFDPKDITPIDLPVESVLIVGVIGYGYQDTQWVWQTFFDQFAKIKPRRFGKPAWDHACHLAAILVNPKTGQLLMEADWEVSKPSDAKDPELLKAATKEVAEAVLDGVVMRKRALLRLGF